MKRTNFLITTIILLFPLTIGAVPQLLNHQGHMLTNHGVPVVGSANVTFNLYADETGGDSVWTQTIPVTFDVGRYSVLLGPGEPELSITLFTGSDLYLGVTLEGQEEFLPRMPIASMPYAFRAEAVEGEVKAIGGLIVDGEVVINDQQQWVGTNISFNDLADIPEDLADGDDIGIEGSGTNGTVAKFTESGLGDSIVVELDSKIGIGTDDPQATLQIVGGMQIEDDTDDCAEGKEGALRWHGNKVEVCDGSDWKSVGGASSMGQSPSQAGISCFALLQQGVTTDGEYWIDPDGGDHSNAFPAYCDMTTDGGGWTLVAVARYGNHGQSGWNASADLNINNSTSLTEHWHFSEAKINALSREDEFRALCFESNNNYHRYWWGVSNYHWSALTSASQSWDSYDRSGTQYATSWATHHYGLVSGNNETTTLITAHSGNHWACAGNSGPGGEGYTGRSGLANLRMWVK